MTPQYQFLLSVSVVLYKHKGRRAMLQKLQIIQQLDKKVHPLPNFMLQFRGAQSVNCVYW